MTISQKVYYSVSPACFNYFKSVWLEKNKKTERQFRNRMKNPTTKDLVLFCHVCKIEETELLRPIRNEFKNIAPFAANLQMTIEP